MAEEIPTKELKRTSSLKDKLKLFQKKDDDSKDKPSPKKSSSVSEKIKT
jgi:hypothetical protein